MAFRGALSPSWGSPQPLPRHSPARRHRHFSTRSSDRRSLDLRARCRGGSPPAPHVRGARFDTRYKLYARRNPLVLLARAQGLFTPMVGRWIRAEYQPSVRVLVAPGSRERAGVTTVGIAWGISAAMRQAGIRRWRRSEADRRPPRSETLFGRPFQPTSAPTGCRRSARHPDEGAPGVRAAGGGERPPAASCVRPDRGRDGRRRSIPAGSRWRTCPSRSSAFRPAGSPGLATPVSMASARSGCASG